MFYQKHIFICTNQKESGKKCCANADAASLAAYAKQRSKELGLAFDRNVRVSSSGCLGRCAEGPCLVVYPQGRWYAYHSQADIDKILEQEGVENMPCSDLQLPESDI